MALIGQTKIFEAAVTTMVDVDMGILDLFFPTVRKHTESVIEYDTATIVGAPLAYNSFMESSNTVEKDGSKIVTIAPVNFNNSITKDEIFRKQRLYGTTDYGDGKKVDPMVASALHGVAKIRMNQIATLKKMTYEALVTHEIADGYKDENGTQDIVFGVPAVNKVEKTGNAGDLYWDDADATPVDDIEKYVLDMLVEATDIVMSSSLYKLFTRNKQVVTTQYNQDNPQNFFKNKDINTKAKFYRAGRLETDGGVSIDIWVERQKYDVSGTQTSYMSDKHIVLGSPEGVMHYAGIPMKGGNVTVAQEFAVEEVVIIDPATNKIVVKSAPLPVLKNGNAFKSVKVLD